MNANRERLAWAMVLGGFTIFIALCVSVPLSVTTYVRTATRPLLMTIQANQGAVTVLHARAGASAVLLPGSASPELEAGANIITTTLADTALLQINDPQTDNLLARVTVYGSSHLVIEEAAAPRYQTSDGRRQLILNLQHGRVRLVTPAALDPNLQLELWLEDGIRLVVEQAGQYSLERANGAVQISVQSGQATVFADGRLLTLFADQRAFIDAELNLTGPLEAARDLVRNGGFAEGMNEWALLAWRIEREDQPAGKMEIISSESGRVLHFERVGIGAAEVTVYQTINQDVTGFQELRALMTFNLLSQNLSICGNLGSECPLTLRIDYEDSTGASRTWQQGFYIVAAFAEGAPLICTTCVPPIMEHQVVPQGQLFAYESNNLLELLAQQGQLPPSRIRSLSLIVSGHSFDVEVVEVALMALD